MPRVRLLLSFCRFCMRKEAISRQSDICLPARESARFARGAPTVRSLWLRPPPCRLAVVVTRYVRRPCLEGDPGSTPGMSILTTGDSEDTEMASKSRNFEAFSRHLALARPTRQRLGPISLWQRPPPCRRGHAVYTSALPRGRSGFDSRETHFDDRQLRRYRNRIKIAKF